MEKTYRIYKITNKINGKCYIGWTSWPIIKRFTAHKVLSKLKPRDCPKFYNAIRKYGIDNFSHEEIFSCSCKPLSCYLEIHYIKLYDSIKNGYNIEPGGTGHSMSEETKKKLSDFRKGKFTGKDNPFYGRHHTEENKRLSSESKSGIKSPNYGKHLSEEHKEKIRKKNTGSGNAMFGKHLSRETKRKMSEKRKGRPGIWLGKHHTEEYKKMMSESVKKALFMKRLLVQSDKSQSDKPA